MSRERENRVARSTVVFTVFGYAGTVLSFVTVPLLLRWLGQENYGLMLTALAFMSYLSFADAGLNWGSVVLISEAHGRGDRVAIASIFRHSLVLALGSATLAVVVAVGVFLAARHGWRLPMFAASSQADYLVLVVALQCATNLLLNAFFNVFQGMQESYWTGFYQGCARLVGPVGVAIAAYVSRNPAIALAVNGVVIAFFGVLGALHLAHKHPWVFARGSVRDAAQYKRQLRTGAKSFGLQIARTIQGTAPVMVISSVVGPAAVPMFSVPMTLLWAVFGVFATWNMSLQPAYGAAWAANERPWVVAAFRRTLNSVVLIGLVAIAGYVALAPEAINLWTHGVLHPSPVMCASVALVLGVQAVSMAVQYCLAGINQHRQIALIELVHTVVMVVSCLVAVRVLGPVGIGPGVLVAYAMTALWLGFGDLARRLESPEVIPAKLWILRVALAATAGIGLGIFWVQLVPVGPGPLFDLALAGVGAVLAAVTMAGGTVLLRVQTFAEWRDWIAQLLRAPRQIVRAEGLAVVSTGAVKS